MRSADPMRYTRAEGRHDQSLMFRASAHHEDTVEYLDALFDRLSNSTVGGASDVTELQERCRRGLTDALADIDLFACLCANPYSADYPARHGMHVAGLASVMGVLAGLDEQAVSDLALGCALHDVGMLRIENKPHLQKRKLREAEFAAIVEHPLETIRVVGSQGLSLESLMVIYQMHERRDGSGYPNGRSGTHCHELAHIASLADAFVALVSPRPHRAGLLPYYAITHLLSEVKEGRYDPDAMRHLLAAVSLFPLGSYVQLEDRRIGRTIRCRPEQYDRPVLEVWNSLRMDQEPTVVDLAEDTEVEIRRPIKRPSV